MKAKINIENSKRITFNNNFVQVQGSETAVGLDNSNECVLMNNRIESAGSGTGIRVNDYKSRKL